MKTIDCLIIGHNDMKIHDYVEAVKHMGENSGAYRDLRLNYIRHNKTLYDMSRAFNQFCLADVPPGGGKRPLNVWKQINPAAVYLGTYLHRRGFSFDYINSFQDEKELLARKLTETDILTIAVTTTYYVSVFPILEVVSFIRSYNRTAKIVVGGPFVSTQVQSGGIGNVKMVFSLIGADYFINNSQGESTLARLIGSLKKRLPVDDIDNLYYRKDQDYISTPTSREKNRLAENMVDWNLFDSRVGEHVTLRMSISCPFNCAFCSFPQNGGEYQTVGVDLIERELHQLARMETVKYIHFIDDTFNIPEMRFKEILRMMIKNKYRFKWHSYFRCQFASEEMVELMKRSGCEAVYLGLESGDDRILKNMNKTATVEKYYAGISLLKKYEIVTHGNFIMGFPGETDETVRQTVHFIKECGINFFRVQLWYCMPHTPIWRERERFKIEGSSFKWSHATMDCHTASGWVDEIFSTIEDPVWTPQYNFDIVGLWHMMQMGLSMQQIKGILKIFRDGVREKLNNPFGDRITSESIIRLKGACH